MSQFFTSGGQIIGVSVLASILPMNIQDWFPLGWTGWISLQSKGLSRVFSNTTKAFDCVDRTKLWKILKEMGISNHLTCLLRNLYAGQEATVRTDMEQQTGSKYGKEYIKYLYSWQLYVVTSLYNLYAEYITWTIWLEERTRKLERGRINRKNLI